MIYRYLGYRGRPDAATARLVDNCAEMVEKKAKFRLVYKKYILGHDPLTIKELNLAIESRDLARYMAGCGECIVTACTLGFDIDKEIRFLQHVDMAKAVVFDRAAGRYLEQMRDSWEKENIPGPHTFRARPGYGDIPLGLNRTLARALGADKTLGLSVTAGGTFLPFKSMLGITGLGAVSERSCMNCVRKDSCDLLKSGRRCYQPG